MMRWIVLFLLFVPLVVHSQERLELEVQLVEVHPGDWPYEKLDYDFSVSAGEAVAMVPRAMEALGVFYDEYNIKVNDRFEWMNCSTPTTLEAQVCDVEVYVSAFGAPGSSPEERVPHGFSPGDIESWATFLKGQTLYPSGTAPNAKQFKLMLLLVPEEFSFLGYRGAAVPWVWIVDGIKGGHWTHRACTAGVFVNSPNSMLVIAHELGHCFGLMHNEDDPASYDIDLMFSTVNGSNFLHHTNNQRLRRQFFPTFSAATMAPMVELPIQH